ncbi:MAG: HpcH/HpaI aldolase/citrate lyase family protein [Bacillota bacterium]
MSRSYLFIPGDVPNMLQNLDVFDADTIIIDFEDAVSINDKLEARMLTHAFLTQYTFDKPAIYIRINDVDTDYFNDDIKTIKHLPIDGIVLPKVSKDALKTMETQYKKYTITFPIIGIIETPNAFFELEAIVSHPLIEGVLLGGEDLTKALGIERTKQGTEILFARSQLVMAAKSYDKVVIDTPYTDVKNLDDLAPDCHLARSLGFTGKAAIHPNHVDTINAQFSPTLKAIEHAKRIVHMHKKTGSMRFSLDGKMIDKPVIERAKDTLKRAQYYGVIR